MDELKKHYENAGLPSASKFIKYLKTNNINTYKKEEIQEFIKNQSTDQVFKKVKKQKGGMPIVAPGENLDYQMDILVLSGDSDKSETKQNKGYKNIFMLMDIFNRKVYLKAMKTKKPAEVVDALNEGIHFLGDKIPYRIASDNGGEYMKDVKKYMSENDIIHKRNIKGDHNALGLIDALSKTIKSMVEKHKQYYNTNIWFDKVEKFNNMYNNRSHTSLKDMTPNEADERPIDARHIQVERIEEALMKQEDKTEKIININDKVRIKIEKGKLEKGYTQTYSTEIYTVVNIENNKYTLDNNKIYRDYMLMKIPETTEQKPNTVKETTDKENKQIRAIKKEGLILDEVLKYNKEKPGIDYKAIKQRNNK